MAKAESSVLRSFCSDCFVLIEILLGDVTCEGLPCSRVRTNAIDDVSLSVSQQEFLTKKVRYVGTYVKQL